MSVLSASNAYYAADVATFIGASAEEIFGRVAMASEFAVELTQNDAWREQVAILKSALDGLAGTIFLEFNVPRIGSRIDAVFVSGTVIFPIEFKVGESAFKRNDINQVWDYALDLKNFHKESHHAPIIPILVATRAEKSDTILLDPHSDNVYNPLLCNSEGLRNLIQAGLNRELGFPLDAHKWGTSSYQPTPTIIEAAQVLYAKHSVDAIARHDAGARNLKITSQRIDEIVEEARKNSHKTIIFVTGVPGAGKTLVGLNVATKKQDPKKPQHAVFLSGNGPLVKVLNEALTRDEVARLKKQHKKTLK